MNNCRCLFYNFIDMYLNYYSKYEMTNERYKSLNIFLTLATILLILERYLKDRE